MKFLSRVVWSEGMYLGPHHFQTQSRYFEDSIAFLAASLWVEPWGLLHAELDQKAIRNGNAVLLHASGIFPDGLTFELPNSDPHEVEEATKEVEDRQKNLGAPSEMALISRLHWWTVEYGLIGTLEKPKIYGAGLLSSIGESVSCLESHVKKIPYSIDAAETAFDITTKQPQLFVCRDFKHLTDVLEEFASRMAFMVGGTEGINKAIELLCS